MVKDKENGVIFMTLRGSKVSTIKDGTETTFMTFETHDDITGKPAKVKFTRAVTDIPEYTMSEIQIPMDIERGIDGKIKYLFIERKEDHKYKSVIYWVSKVKEWKNLNSVTNLAEVAEDELPF